MKDIEIRRLDKSFGEKTVLRKFSAVLPGGKITCLMGPSGCGKTTLASILLGLTEPDGGEISGLPEKRSAVFQEDRLCEDFSALSNVRLVTGKAVPEQKIRDCLRELGLGDSLKKPVREMSGGMKRRVAIARALLAEGELLLLDEPFKGLDEATKADVVGLLQKSVAQKTVLLITHDPAEAELLGAQIIKMEAVS